jgi:CheY-like chemotaxis protein
MSEAGAAPRVLLIDSNVYFVKRMTDALVKEGFQVFHHPVASYALTMIEWNPPDIILCATELREMGAFEIVPVLRSDPKTARWKRIVPAVTIILTGEGIQRTSPVIFAHFCAARGMGSSRRK